MGSRARYVGFDKPGGFSPWKVEDYIACRLKGDPSSSHYLRRRCPDGTTVMTQVPCGSEGYIINELSSTTLLAIIYDKRKNVAQFEIDDILLVRGARVKEFSMELPPVRQALSDIDVVHPRSTTLLGRTILNVWADIHANHDTLDKLGLDRLPVVVARLNEPASRQWMLNCLLSSFNDAAWAKLNRSDVTLSDLSTLRPVTSSWPNQSSGNCIIYARLYDQPAQGSRVASPWGKYVGRSSQAHTRNQQHEAAIVGIAPKTRHYELAEQYSRRRMFPMMSIAACDLDLASVAEFTLCCLMRSWNRLLIRVGVRDEELNDALSSGQFDFRLAMTTLSRVVDASLQRSGFQAIEGEGCNWNCPIQEEHWGERRIWDRFIAHAVDGRKMLVHRWQTKTTRTNPTSEPRTRWGIYTSFKPAASAAASHFNKHSTLTLLVHLDDLGLGDKGLKLGTPFVLVVEVMADGNAHQNPWYRHPVHGAFSNDHELHSLGLRIEWTNETDGKWYSFPLQERGPMFKPYMPITHIKGKTAMSTSAPTTYVKDTNVTTSWRKTTTFLQFFLNREYIDHPSYLYRSMSPHIRELVYDHHFQTVKLVTVPPTKMNAPTKNTLLRNYRAMLPNTRPDAAGIPGIWRDVEIGKQPEQTWFMYTDAAQRHGGGVRQCTVCRYIGGEAGTCLNPDLSVRRPTIPDTEPERQKIMEYCCAPCWDIYRRPCVWANGDFQFLDNPPNQPRPVVVGNQRPTYCPRVYEPLIRYNIRTGAAAVEIEAPMNLEAYRSLKDVQFEDLVVPDDALRGEAD